MSKRTNYMEERLKKFDALCLNQEEIETVSKWNETELQALRDRKKNMVGFAWNGAMAMFGSPMAAVKTVDSANKVNKADKMIRDTRNNLEQLRSMAQMRYEQATGLKVDNVLNQMEIDCGPNK